jgi:hypothetical protein
VVQWADKSQKWASTVGPLGRNSPKWALGRIFFWFCTKLGFFFSHQTLLPEGGTTAKWKPKFMLKQKSFLPEVGIFRV